MNVVSRRLGLWRNLGLGRAHLAEVDGNRDTTSAACMRRSGDGSLVLAMAGSFVPDRRALHAQGCDARALPHHHVRHATRK